MTARRRMSAKLLEQWRALQTVEFHLEDIEAENLGEICEEIENLMKVTRALLEEKGLEPETDNLHDHLSETA